ncbi:MAG: helix-turn-helix domain-containing protein [Aquabacterium sp.]|nr:helix-turn-helix domain-containing protein [Aquabacterium sp.]
MKIATRFQDLVFPIQYAELAKVFCEAAGRPVPEELLRAAGLGAPTEGVPAAAPTGFFNGHTFEALLRLMVQCCAAECAASEQILAFVTPSTIGQLGLLAIVAKDVREVVHYALRFAQLVMPGYELRLALVDEQAHVSVIHNADYGDLTPLMTEIAMGAMAKIAAMAAPPIPQFDYYFKHQPDGAPMQIPGTSDRCLHFACKENKIVFPASFLSQPVLFANQYTKGVMEGVVQQQLTDVAPKAVYTTKVKMAIIQDLQSGTHSDLVSLASSLNISARTLARRLSDELTSFVILNAEVRLDYARTQLRNTDKSILSIARQAGFSDAGNFSHAFKRQYGVTPSDVRA